MHLTSIFAFRSSTSIRAVDELANQMVWLKLSRWKRPFALYTPTSLETIPQNALGPHLFEARAIQVQVLNVDVPLSDFPLR